MGVVYCMARRYMFIQYCRAKKHIDDFFLDDSITMEEAIRECNNYSDTMKAYAFVEFLHYSKKGYFIRDAFCASVDFTGDLIIHDRYLNFVEENEKWIKEKYMKWIS